VQRVLLVVVAVLAACKPVPPVAPSVPAFKPDAAGLVRAVEAAAHDAGLHPGERAPSPSLAELPEGALRVDRLADVPASGAPGPVDVFQTPWRRVPWARVEDGRLVVRWETREPAPAGALYVGLAGDPDPLAPPRYGAAEREDLLGPDTRHVAAHDLAALLAASPGAKADDPAVALWRVEAYDPATGRARAWEGRTAFEHTADGFVQAPAVVLGPTVDLLTTTSAVVRFDTDAPTVGAVALAGQVPVAAPGPPSTHHEVALDGLQPGHTWLYRVAASDGAHTTLTPMASFRTRRLDAPVVVAILGDSEADGGPESAAGIDASALWDLAVRGTRDGAEALFFVGDRADGPVSRGDLYDLRLAAWLHILDPVHRGLPIYVGLGGHDALVDGTSGPLLALGRTGPDSAEAHLARAVVNPPGAPAPEAEGAPPYDEAVWSWDVGDVHFVMLDTDYWWSAPAGDPRLKGRGNRPGMLMDHQLAWLGADLAKARKAGAVHIVVLGGEPAFPVAGAQGMWWGGDQPEVNAMRTRFWKLLAHYHVLAYVSGGEHAYSRTLIGPETVPGVDGSVWSIVTGGAATARATRQPPAAWAGQVRAFSDRPHLTEWTFDADRATLRVVDRWGGLVEEVDLVGARAAADGRRP